MLPTPLVRLIFFPSILHDVLCVKRDKFSVHMSRFTHSICIRCACTAISGYIYRYLISLYLRKKGRFASLSVSFYACKRFANPPISQPANSACPPTRQPANLAPTCVKRDKPTHQSVPIYANLSRHHLARRTSRAPHIARTAARWPRQYKAGRGPKNHSPGPRPAGYLLPHCRALTDARQNPQRLGLALAHQNQRDSSCDANGRGQRNICH